MTRTDHGTAVANTPGFPLHDDDAEDAVIAACCSWPDGVDAALDAGLRAEHFYRPSRAHAFQAACSLSTNGEPVDPVTVAAKLGELGLPGPRAAELLSAVANAPSLSRVVHYSRIVVQAARRRVLLGNLAEATEVAKGPGSFDEVAERVDQLLTAAVADSLDAAGEPLPIGRVVDSVIAELRDGKERGLPTGYRDLDRLVGSLARGSFTLVAARPSVGKTAFVLGIAQRAARAGVLTLFVSAEQAVREIGLRQIADIAHVPTDRLRPPVAPRDLERVGLAGSELADLPLLVSDHNRGANSVAQDARRLARKDGLGLVVVDYLQLLVPDSRGERRELEVAVSSKALKRLAVELDIPVVCAAQVNRELEHRYDRRPRLADLRESGSLEQDADLVVFLHRDEDEESPHFGTVEVIVAKNRNGPTGSVRMAWLAERMVFADLSPREGDR